MKGGNVCDHIARTGRSQGVCVCVCVCVEFVCEPQESLV